jgi:hypothetical protein
MLLLQAPKYAADWAYLLQRLVDMPHVMAIEPNFVVSHVFSAEAVAARHQQRQQQAVPVAAAAEDTAAAVAEEDSTDTASVTAEAAAPAVQMTGGLQQVLQPSFAVRPVPSAAAHANVALPAGSLDSFASMQQDSKDPAPTVVAAVSSAGTGADGVEVAATQATTARAVAAAAVEWLPRQAVGGRRLKAW